MLAAEPQQLDTEVSYVGDSFWLTTKLSGQWMYGLSETEEGIQIGHGPRDDTNPIRSQTISVSAKEAFDTWPEEHSAEWAADAYRKWELNIMKTEGVKKGLYRLRDTKMGEVDLYDKRLFTFTYKQTFKNPLMSDYVNHAFLFLYFPDDYATSRKFYWIHFLQTRDKKDKSRPSLDPVKKVIAGLSLDLDEAPNQTTIIWSTPDMQHTSISAPELGRSYYFDTNSEQQCFAFYFDAIWFPAKSPGMFISPNQYDHGGVTLLSEDELARFEGENLLARAADCQISMMEEQQNTNIETSTVEPLACLYGDTIKWTSEVPIEMFGKTFTGLAVWYIAEVKPGWVAVVSAIRQTNKGDDDLARDLFESIAFSDDPDCFSNEISEFRK